MGTDKNIELHIVTDIKGSEFLDYTVWAVDQHVVTDTVRTNHIPSHGSVVVYLIPRLESLISVKRRPVWMNSRNVSILFRTNMNSCQQKHLRQLVFVPTNT